jgi:hypothetical protein
MQESFINKNKTPLEKTILYTISSQRWPLSFQGYEYKPEGDYKKLVAVFWDYEGHPIYFNKEQVALAITPATPTQIKQSISSAKGLVEWLSHYQIKQSQSQPKFTDNPKDSDLLENRCCPH